MPSELILEQSVKAFDGYQCIYSHDSYTVGCTMNFGIYIPSIAETQCVPLLIFLSDFMCTEQNFITKSGVQHLASKYGFIVVNPDTCPRDCYNMFDKSHELNLTANIGYYVDATESKWSENYQMFSYVNDEFYELIISHFNVDTDRIGIFGHGMGGHGALISFFKCPGQYKSVSAFAPICNPMNHEKSLEIFQNLFGSNENRWKEYDACELVMSYTGPIPYGPILIDQGSNDEYNDSDKFLLACTNALFPIELREQIGYDHSYYFLMTFLEDHFLHHKKEFQYLNNND